MCGAEPLFLSAAFVLEEGLPLADLERVVASMAEACARVGAPLVTGDTKVVDKGKGDGLFVNTSGVGRVRDGVHVAPDRARPGDAVLVSGPVGDHGIAVMAAREGIEFETALVSDSAPVEDLVNALLQAVPDTHVLRDPTRGGLATALCEIARSSHVGIRIEEAAVPVRPEVQGACEILGFDPLYVACEGRFLAIVPRAAEQGALSALLALPAGAMARRIGAVTEDDPGRVVLQDAHREPPPAREALRRAAPEDLLMHEYSLVRALLARVEREARARNALAVRRLSVRIGALAGVERELFESAYQASREGTLCAAAELVVQPVLARWACSACARPMTAGEVLPCPDCGAPARLLGGDEIVLDRIEMEVA